MTVEAVTPDQVRALICRVAPVSIQGIMALADSMRGTENSNTKTDELSVQIASLIDGKDLCTALTALTNVLMPAVDHALTLIYPYDGDIH